MKKFKKKHMTNGLSGSIQTLRKGETTGFHIKHSHASGTKFLLQAANNSMARTEKPEVLGVNHSAILPRLQNEL